MGAVHCRLVAVGAIAPGLSGALTADQDTDWRAEVRQRLTDVPISALVGALLLIRSYQRLQQTNLGIEPDRVLTFDVFVPSGRQRDAAAARRTLEAIEDRLASTPGVEIAAAISGLPLVSAGGGRWLRY